MQFNLPSTFLTHKKDCLYNQTDFFIYLLSFLFFVMQVTLDFAGRQVIEEANLTGQMMYSHNEALQQEHLLPDKDQQKTQEKDRACIVNPIVLQPPKVKRLV